MGWGRGRRQPALLEGSHFLQSTLERTGPWSGHSGQEVDAGDKSSAPAKSESVWRAPPPSRLGTHPPPLPAPLQADGEAAPPGSGAAQPGRHSARPPGPCLPGSLGRPSSGSLPVFESLSPPPLSFLFLPLFLPFPRLSSLIRSLPLSPSLFTINSTQTLQVEAQLQPVGPLEGGSGLRRKSRRKISGGERSVAFENQVGRNSPLCAFSWVKLWSLVLAIGVAASAGELEILSVITPLPRPGTEVKLASPSPPALSSHLQYTQPPPRQLSLFTRKNSLSPLCKCQQGLWRKGGRPAL